MNIKTTISTDQILGIFDLLKTDEYRQAHICVDADFSELLVMLGIQPTPDLLDSLVCRYRYEFMG